METPRVFDLRDLRVRPDSVGEVPPESGLGRRSFLCPPKRDREGRRFRG